MTPRDHWRPEQRASDMRGGAMVDVLFAQSYFLRQDPKERAAMSPYPPLGTMYAASFVRQRGYTAALFDSMLAEDEHELRHAIDLHRPRVVVLYDDDFNYLTKMCLSRMREAAFTMTAIAKAAGMTVVVHGSDPTDNVERYLARGADYIICGEGEHTLAELLDFLLKGSRSLDSIRGLAYMSHAGLRRTAPREILRDLDTLPFPARDLVDNNHYRSLWTRRHGYFSMNIVTTRGCPYHCNWCAKPVYGQRYNARSPRNVVDEMLSLKKLFRPDHLWFCDDIFGLKPGWTEQFCEEVKGRDAIIPYKCLARVDLLLKGDTIEHLRRSGCVSVWVGAESGSQRILDAMEKGTTVAEIYEASRRLKEAGIGIGFFLQYGYPGETEDDIALTLKMVRECKPDDIGISVSYPLPGTKFYENVRQQLGSKDHWQDSQDLAMMFVGTHVPDFYRVLHRVTHKNFRVWQAADIVREIAVRPWRLDAQRFRRIIAAPYHAVTLAGQRHRLEMLSRKQAAVREGIPHAPMARHDGRI